MTNTHRHDARTARNLTMRDGTARRVETCTCEARRTVDRTSDGIVEVSEWAHLESMRAA